MALIFLKLGGSLITDKTRPYTPRPEKLNLLTAEIASVLKENTNIHLVIGHGSGSFGHAAASRYNTRLGVSCVANILIQYIENSQFELKSVFFKELAAHKGVPFYDIIVIRKCDGGLAEKKIDVGTNFRFFCDVKRS